VHADCIPTSLAPTPCAAPALISRSELLDQPNNFVKSLSPATPAHTRTHSALFERLFLACARWMARRIVNWDAVSKHLESEVKTNQFAQFDWANMRAHLTVIMLIKSIDIGTK
jgi:hypothetical protein